MIAGNHVIGIVAAVVLIAAVVVTVLPIGIDGAHGSPEAVVRRFLEVAFNETDASQLLALVDPQALEQVKREMGMDMDEIRREVQAHLDETKRLIEMGASFSFEIGKPTVLDGTASTNVTIRFSRPGYDDAEFSDRISTVKRDGRWYLAELRF